MVQSTLFFPPELIHNIIDFLADDRQTLYNSSLASYAFLHPSRKHIFGNILLRSSAGNKRPARRLLDFLFSAQHLVSYITSLRVMTGHHHAFFSGEGKKGWIYNDDALAIVFTSLTYLQEISIESTNLPLKWPTVPLDLQKAVMELLNRSTLSQVSLVLVEDFPIQPLRTSSNLRKLVLRCVTLMEGRSTSCTKASTSTNLENLHIVESRDSRFIGLNTWLQNSDAAALDFSHLKRLSLIIHGRSMSYGEDMFAVSRMLDLCSPSLELLKLTPPLMLTLPSDLADHPFHLRPMPKLRKLELGLEISDFDNMETSISLIWLTELFSNLPPSNIIEDIILKCEVIQANPLGDFDHRIWTKIDGVLTSKGLGCLRRVTLVIYPIYSQTKRHLSITTDLLQQEMRILRKRNILQIEKRYGKSVQTTHCL